MKNTTVFYHLLNSTDNHMHHLEFKYLLARKSVYCIPLTQHVPISACVNLFCIQILETM